MGSERLLTLFRTKLTHARYPITQISEVLFHLTVVNSGIPKISVVIPCFNAQKYVASAIESVLSQTHTHLEIIVIDDGSTDDSLGVIRSFGDQVVVSHGPNRGVCVARNTGVALATGEWIQFLDADDLLHPMRFETMLGCAGKHKDASFVFSPRKSVPAEFTKNDIQSVNSTSLVDTSSLEYDALRANYLPTAGLFPRSFVDRVGPWDTELRRWTDLEYHARMSILQEPFASVTEPLSFYRQHDGPRISSANHNHTGLENGRLALKKARDTLEKVWPNNYPVCQYLAPFYLTLARAAAATGESQAFRELLVETATLRDDVNFSRKCKIALACEALVGPKLTSLLLEFALPA